MEFKQYYGGAPQQTAGRPADETAEALGLITKRLLPAIVRKLQTVEKAQEGYEANQQTLLTLVRNIPADPPASVPPASVPPASSDLEDRVVALVQSYEDRLGAMAHELADMVGRLADLEERLPKPRKRTSANVLAKFNKLTASEVAAVNHVLRQTSSPDAAARFTGTALPVVRYIAAMSAEDYRQHVLHKRTSSETNPPEGMTEADYQFHWTVPVEEEDAGVLPESALGDGEE